MPGGAVLAGVREGKATRRQLEAQGEFDKTRKVLRLEGGQQLGIPVLLEPGSVTSSGLAVVSVDLPESASARCVTPGAKLLKEVSTVAEIFGCYHDACAGTCSHVRHVTCLLLAPLKVPRAVSCPGCSPRQNPQATEYVRLHNLPQAVLSEVPRRWEIHGDLALLPAEAFSSADWLADPLQLWTAVASALGCGRLGRKARVDPGPRRESRVTILHGDNGRVRHVDNGIVYQYDVTKCVGQPPGGCDAVTDPLGHAVWPRPVYSLAMKGAPLVGHADTNASNQSSFAGPPRLLTPWLAPVRTPYIYT